MDYNSGVATGGVLEVRTPPPVENVTSYLVTYVRILQNCFVLILFGTFRLILNAFN